MDVLAAIVAVLTRGQHRSARREALRHALLLFADLPVQLVIDGDECLAFHFVRRPANVGQVSQEPVDRYVVIPEYGPRSCPQSRGSPPAARAVSSFSTSWTRQEITMNEPSSRQVRTLVVDVEDTSVEAWDNSAQDHLGARLTALNALAFFGDLPGHGDLFGDVAEFELAVLRARFEHVESLIFADLVAFHDDAECFAYALARSDGRL